MYSVIVIKLLKKNNTFSVFGTPDETLALVFDILRENWPLPHLCPLWQRRKKPFDVIYLYKFNIDRFAFEVIKFLLRN